MSDKYVIYNPVDGEVVYLGGKPKEPLTPKKQSLIDSGYEIKRVKNLPRKDRGSDLEFMRVKDGKLERKTDAEISAIEAKREQDEADRHTEYLKKLKAELEAV